MIAISCTATLLLGGCAALPFKEDNRPVEAVIDRAEQLIKAKAYSAAANEYAVVIRKAPTVGKHYLRRAEVLERIDEDKEAHSTYERGLKMVPEDDPDQIQLMHRLALVDANHLFKLDEAEELLTRLPPRSIEKLDLAAFLYYQASQFDEAIKLLNKALEKVRDTDQKALLLYHAALIYVKLDDEKNTFGSLYFAINNAEHLGLIRDIEQLWQELNEEP
jgi:Tfp pilus assembly protein PilF